MSELSVYDLKSRETWQELLDEMQSALGMPTALLDSKNIILQASGERNELCREIRSRKKALPVICGQSQQFMARWHAPKNLPLWKSARQEWPSSSCRFSAIKISLALLLPCGCMLPETEIEKYLIEKATGIVGDAIDEMAEKVPFVQKEKLQKLAEDLFCRLNPS